MRKDFAEKIDNGLLFMKIQQKRKRMHKVADDFGLNSNQTLSVSQELDTLINAYLKSNLQKINH